MQRPNFHKKCEGSFVRKYLNCNPNPKIPRNFNFPLHQRLQWVWQQLVIRVSCQIKYEHLFFKKEALQIKPKVTSPQHMLLAHTVLDQSFMP